MNFDDILLFCSEYERKYLACNWATVTSVDPWN